jgi:UDP-N-acetylmuramyl tripeptide synthase
MALAAAQAARISPATGLARMSGVRAVAGRYESFQYAGKEMRLLLAKNPASWLETLDLLTPDSLVVLAFNARDLDGTDTSWLWDVDFGALRDRHVFVMGERRFDMAVRLHYDRVPFTLIDGLAEAGSAGVRQRLDVVANYTAFLAVITMIRKSPLCRPAR